MKVCGRCMVERHEAAFAKRGNGLQSWCKMCQKQYRELEAVRERRLELAPRHRAKKAEHKANNRLKYLSYENKRRAMTNNYVDYHAILERDGFVCHICGGNVDPDQVNFDHVKPLSKGGEHSAYNIRVAHASCNFRKHTKWEEDKP